MGGRNSSFKKFGFIDIFITLLFLSISVVCVNLFWHDLMQTVHLQNVEPVGTVVIRKNTVQRRFSNRVVWDRLTNESPVYIGDLIRVADVSAATLKIQEADIFLEENTLIRIMLSADGETLQIILDEGTISVVATDENLKIELEIDGRNVSAQPGSVLTAAISPVVSTANPANTNNAEDRRDTPREVSIQTVQSVEWAASTDKVSTASISVRQPKLISPAVNSIFRYQEGTPVINFQWEELEDAVSYKIEVCKTPDFSDLMVNKNTFASFLTETGLEEGVWFWRVLPVYPSIFNAQSVYSSVNFFRLEKIVAVAATAAPETEVRSNVQSESESIMDWLVLEAPTPANLPPELPPEIVSAHFTKEEIAVAIAAAPPEVLALTPPPPTISTTVPAASSTPEAVPASAPPPPEPPPPPPPPAPPAPPPRLAAPQNMLPVRGTRYETNELQNLRRINFSWSSVPQATAYIFTLYQQTPAGRRQIVQTDPITRTNYSMENLRVLDRGTFIWQVEAVRTGSGNTIARRGTIGESTFILDFQVPGEIELQVEDLGIQHDE
ncbi:MAG: hypothetical protein LBU88_00650 [Treponema sp.]|jgi:hypothetical protein|nr:hypothetical protein [Treponema sp.]